MQDPTHASVTHTQRERPKLASYIPEHNRNFYRFFFSEFSADRPLAGMGATTEPTSTPFGMDHDNINLSSVVLSLLKTHVLPPPVKLTNKHFFIFPCQPVSLLACPVVRAPFIKRVVYLQSTLSLLFVMMTMVCLFWSRWKQTPRTEIADRTTVHRAKLCVFALLLSLGLFRISRF